MFLISVFKRFFVLFVCLFFSVFLSAYPADASVKLNGKFKATQSCEALQSIRKDSNPGDIRLSPEIIYPVVAKNKRNETHYHIRVDGADPELRWVPIDCGELLGSDPTPVQAGAENVLAINWQPAFCETHSKKTECKAQIATRFGAQNFTLHGLWPEPIYCGVSDPIKKLDEKSETWPQMPEIELSEVLRQELATKMPGVASGLHLHEWYKHGTCYSDTPEEYYAESLALLDQVNQSAVRTLFVDNIGRELEVSAIRDQFSDSFDNNAGKKVAVSCAEDKVPTRRRMIVEMKLNLNGQIEGPTPITGLLENGKKAGGIPRKCRSGEIDRAGLG